MKCLWINFCAHLKCHYHYKKLVCKLGIAETLFHWFWFYLYIYMYIYSYISWYHGIYQYLIYFAQIILKTGHNPLLLDEFTASQQRISWARHVQWNTQLECMVVILQAFISSPEKNGWHYANDIFAKYPCLQWVKSPRGIWIPTRNITRQSWVLYSTLGTWWIYSLKYHDNNWSLLIADSEKHPICREVYQKL